jgi:hypothetical protein
LSDAKLAGTVVMAPSEEEETSAAYLAKTPCVYRGFGGFQLAMRF